MTKSSFIRRVLLCAAVPLAACSDNPAGSDLGIDEILGCERVGSIDVPGSASGSLTSSDCDLGDGSYVDFYAFRVSGSREVTISMRSSQIDSYVLLLSSSGDLIELDDDSGANSGDALLTTTLSSGTYVVAANSFDAGETGSYTLRVE